MNKMKIEMCNCEETLLNEIANKKAKRKTVAMSLELARKSSDIIDWPRVNLAIKKRWSISGLRYIKNLAWSGKCFK